MRTNMAGWDRALRVALGLGALILRWGGVIGGVLGVVCIVVGVVALATGLVGYCPLYTVLGVRTKRA